MEGKPGRYISIENGPSAVKLPKIRMRKKYVFLDITKYSGVVLCQCNADTMQQVRRNWIYLTDRPQKKRPRFFGTSLIFTTTDRVSGRDPVQLFIYFALAFAYGIWNFVF